MTGFEQVILATSPDEAFAKVAEEMGYIAIGPSKAGSFMVKRGEEVRLFGKLNLNAANPTARERIMVPSLWSDLNREYHNDN